jgi:hypothetical protein
LCYSRSRSFQSEPNANKVNIQISTLLFITNNDNKEEDGQICIGGQNGEIHLYKIDKGQMKFTTTRTLLQEFPNVHKSFSINSLIQLNETTLISSSDSFLSSDNSIVIWSQSQSTASAFSFLSYEPQQRITKNQTEGSVSKLIKLTNDEFAASSFSMPTYLVQIWSRSKQGNETKEEEKFVIKQRIQTNERCYSLLYISITNELICGSYNSIRIFAHSSSTRSLFELRQEISCSSSFSLNSDVSSLVELSTAKKLVEFASGHSKGQVMIWSKKILRQTNSNYSLMRALQLFDYFVSDILFVNNLNLLIACSARQGKISVIYKYKERKGDLEHREVSRLIQLRGGGGKNDGVFVSGGGGGGEGLGGDECLKIWEPHFLVC